jgi:hypothetical protein
MTDDLVKRLRGPAYQTAADYKIKQEAADRIERLEKALLDIFDYECRESSQSLIANTARDALWPKKLEKTDD